MEEFNLDIHAITAANNLLAAQLDARMFQESKHTNMIYLALIISSPARSA